jgi:hypothetical protein
MKSSTAPLVIFSFNRPNKIKKLFKSLKKNRLSKLSKIYIFQDNFRFKKDKKSVLQNIRFFNSLKGFKKVKFILRKKNYGFYKNFYGGLNYVFKYEKRGIILEDDLIVSKYFLNYMNMALNKYESNKNVWHISGWNYDIKIQNKYDAYFGKHISSWGWATWRDRFLKYEKKPQKLLKWKNKKIKKFNLNDSYNFYSQIIRNNTGALDTFAIFWYATIFKNNGLTLFPKKTLVINNGIGKDATHTKKTGVFTNQKISQKKFFIFPDEAIEDTIISKKIENYLKKNKIKNYFFRILRFFK